MGVFASRLSPVFLWYSLFIHSRFSVHPECIALQKGMRQSARHTKALGS